MVHRKAGTARPLVWVSMFIFFSALTLLVWFGNMKDIRSVKTYTTYPKGFSVEQVEV